MIEKMISGAQSHKALLSSDPNAKPRKGLAMLFLRYKEALEKGYDPISNTDIDKEKIIPL